MNDKDEGNGEAKEPDEMSSYTCPGELYSIPRSIHVARLAAFYPKCRDCDHRLDSKTLLPRTDEHFQEVQRRASRSSMLTDESVRGVYLNELDRNRALKWGEALAAYLWDQQPMVAREESDPSIQMPLEKPEVPTISINRGPVVVVGFDERPSSPDIATGVVLGLRRMGCTVIDLGQIALPILAYHVHSLETAAGLYVTGAGRDPSWVGFDLLARGALPFPQAGLHFLEQAVKTGISRQTRQIGGHRPFQGLRSYEDDLTQYFHALRPLRIVCGSATKQMPRLLDRIFSRLPCEFTHVALPTRHRNLFDIRDADLNRVGAAVIEGQRHLGMVIDEDGRHAAFITNLGRLVSPREVARLLIEYAQRDDHHAKFVVTSSWRPDVERWLVGRDAKAIDGGESAENLVQKMIECQATLGFSADGRIWFGYSYPACDALLVLANVLQALSLSDAPFSEVISRFSEQS